MAIQICNGKSAMTATPNTAAGAMDKPKKPPYVRTTRCAVEAVFSSPVRLALVDLRQLARLCHSRLKHTCQGARPGADRRPVPTVGCWHRFGNLFGKQLLGEAELCRVDLAAKQFKRDISLR